VSLHLWSGRAFGHRRAPLGLAAAVACFTTAYAIGSARGPGGSSPVLFMVGLVGVGALALLWSAAMAHVGVRISAYSVQVWHGLVPVPVVSVPLRSVRRAWVVDIEPTLWPNWSGTWTPGRHRSVIVRPGPALALDLGSGRRLVVSVDQPEQAVAAVQHLRAGAR
jgi:hypothetical protein